jgi:preprotein translocase subunit SecG
VLALALVLVPMFTFLLVPILLLLVLLRHVLLRPSAVAASAATFGATSASFVDSAEIGVFF